LVAFREVTRFLPEIEGYPTLVPSLRFAIIGLLLVLVIRFKPEGLLGNPDELVTTEDDT
jgi:branched-chain amino acid transport system permease protein